VVRLLTGQGDNLHDLLGGEGGRRARARRIGQQGFDGRGEGPILRVRRFSAGQGRLGGVPAGALETDLAAIHAQGATNVAVAEAGGGQQHPPGAQHQMSAGGPASAELRQDGLLARGEINR
jgi:hypothetical protein